MRSVERKHFAVAADVGALAGDDGEEEEIEKHGQHDGAKGYGVAVPIVTTADEEGQDAEEGAEDDHGVETDEAALEETAGGHGLRLKTTVVGVADDEAGKDEEEVDGKIAMVAGLMDDGGSKTFVAVVPDDNQGSNTAEGVKE